MDMIPASVTVADPVPAATEHAPTSRAIGVESSPSDISIPLNSENSNKNISGEGKKGQEAAFKLMDVLTDRYGAIFRTYSGDSRRNGFFDPKSGVIHINENSDAPMVDTVSHEFLHFFKQIDLEGYELLKRQVDKDLDAEKFLEYKKDLLSTYDELGIDYSQMSESEINDMVREEAMSDLMAEVMRNPNTIERIALENRSLAEKIIDCLRKMVDEIKAAFSSMGNVADPEVRALVKNFDLISEIYQEVLAGSNAQFNGDVKSETGKIKYSVLLNLEENSNPLIDILKNNVSYLVNEPDIFNVKDTDVARNEETASKIILNYFDSIGNVAKHPSLGVVELKKPGAKATTFHGIGKDKITAVAGIKSVIEKGKIINHEKNWKGRGYDTYIISGKGKLNNKDVILGVVVKSYPNQKLNKKFYVHEIIKAEVDSDAATENRQTYVNENTSANKMIPHSNNIVNNNIRNNDLNDASKIQNSVVRRRDKAQDAIDKYKESGDVRDLPPNSWASGYARDAKNKVIYLENQLSEAEYNAKYNAETQEDNAALTELIKKLEQKHDEALKEFGIAEELRETVKPIKAILSQRLTVKTALSTISRKY